MSAARDPAASKPKKVRRKSSGPAPPPRPTLGQIPQLEKAPGAKQAARAERKAKKVVRKIAQRNQPAPYVPKLANPTPTQRTAARKIRTDNAQRRDRVERSLTADAEKSVTPAVVATAAETHGWKYNPKTGLAVVPRKRQILGIDKALSDVEDVMRYSGEGNPFDRNNWELDKDATFSHSEANDAVHQTGLKVLEQTTRPVHGVAGAVDAAVKGKSLHEVHHAFTRGVLNKDKITFSEVLKHAGAPKWTQGAGGFVLDVALDPTTYVTLGAGGVAKKAAQEAAESAARHGADKATVAAIAKNVRGAAEKHASEHLEHKGRGAQIGMRFHVPFTDKQATPKLTIPGTKAAGHAKPVRFIRKKVRESRPVQAVGKALAPDFREAHVKPAEHLAAREADRLHRAAEHRADAKAIQTKHSLKAAVGDAAAQADVIAAVERAPVHPVTDVQMRRVRTPGYERKLVVRKTKRDVEAARRKEAHARGRAETVAATSSKRTVREAIDLAHSDRVPQSPHFAEADQVVKDFHEATKERSRASTELTKANKQFRNAHEGARDLYTDAERIHVETRLSAAKARTAAAKRQYEDAKTALHGFADQAAGRRAVGQEASNLAGLDRQPPAALRRLEKARGTLAQREAEHAAAKQAAKGIRSTPKYETVAVDKTGRRVSDINAESPKVTPESIAHGDVARHVEDLNARMNEAEIKAGVRKADSTLPDYFPHVHEANVAKKGAIKQGARLLRKRKRYGSDKHRKMEGTIRELEARGVNPFTQDLPAAMASRVHKSGRRVANAEYVSRLAATGGVLEKAPNSFPEHYAAYTHIDGKLTKLAKEDGSPDFQSIDAAIRQGKDVRQLNEKVIDPRMKDVGHRTAVWDKVQGKWKYLVTQLSPSYHTGNLVGDTVLAHEADTSLPSFFKSAKAINVSRKVTKARKGAEAGRGVKVDHDGTVKIQGQRVKVTDLMEEASREGAIQTGFVGSEISDLAGKSKDSWLARFGENRENFPRLATYISARNRGLSAKEATAWTNKHHIDYGDLTEFEQNVKRYAIPFLTFSARNTRTQVTKLVTRPGKLATLQKAREEAIKAAGFDPDEFDAKLKDYQQRGAPLPVGVKTMLTPKTPIEQGLALLPNKSLIDEGKKLLNMTGPAKIIPELIANYSFFFGEKIEDASKKNGELTHAPDWIGTVPAGLRKHIGIKKGRDGWYWPKRLDYMVRQIPESAAVKDLTTAGTNAHGRERWQSAASALGVKLDPIDDKQQAVDAIYDRLADVQKQLTRLQTMKLDRTEDRSKYTPEYAKLLDQQSKLNKIKDQALTEAGRPKDPRVVRRRRTSSQSVLDGLDGNSGSSSVLSGLK